MPPLPFSPPKCPASCSYGPAPTPLNTTSHRHCKPGGWIESQELSVDARSDDNSLPSDSYIHKWCENQEAAAQSVGMTLLMSGGVLKKQMEDAGFENVTVRDFKIPIGTWASDAKMKEMGGFQLVAMLEGIQGLTVDFWVNCLGWSVEEVGPTLFSFLGA